LFVTAMVLLVWRWILSRLISQHSKIGIKCIDPAIRFGTLGIILLALFAYSSSIPKNNTTISNFNATTSVKKQATSKKSHAHKKHDSSKNTLLSE
jgi:hypothetical protein